MFAKDFLKYLESRRGSESLIFKILLYLKDFFWILSLRSLKDLILYFYNYNKPRKYSRFWIKNYNSKAFFIFSLKNQTLVIPQFNGIDGEICVLKKYFKDYVPGKGETVMDIGAFHGLMTIALSLLVENEGKVFSIEPDPENFLVLKKNIDKLKIKNVVLINKAVSNKNGKINFNSLGNKGSSAFGNKNSEVDAFTLDSLTKQIRREVSFIKMDIEGSEIEALKGAKKLLFSGNVHWAIASYHIRNGEKTCFELNKLFSHSGYRAYNGFNAHLTTYAHRK